MVCQMLAPLPLSAETGDAVIQVRDAWVRETVPGQSTGAAYMRIRSKESLELIEVKSTASKSAELHRMSMKDDVMRMREARAVALSPDKEVELGPNGTHVMLVDLRRPLKAGDSVVLNLSFRRANGGKLIVPVRAVVKSMAEEPMHGH
jgi:copper(I)-binding protein